MNRLLLAFLLGAFCQTNRTLAQPDVPASANQLQVSTSGFAVQPFEPREPASLSEAAVNQTPERFFGHPEFGQKAWNAPCESCSELIHERTAYKRLYLDWQDPDKFYLQQSYAPLHYRDAQGWLRTIDPRLAPTEMPGVFRAANQPHPVEIDLNKGCAKLTLAPGMELKLQEDVRLHLSKACWLGTNENREPELSWRPVVPTEGSENWPEPLHLLSGKLRVEDARIGANGLADQRFFPDLGMERRISTGRSEIKTDYVLSRKPFDGKPKGTLCLEEQMTLPAGSRWTLADGSALPEANFVKGPLFLVDETGRKLARLGKAVTFDAAGARTEGSYWVKQDGDVAKVMLFMPLEWLNAPERRYPVTIDPLIEAIFNYSELPGAPDDIAYPNTPGGRVAGATLSDIENNCWGPSEGICEPYEMPVELPVNATIDDARFAIELQILGPTKLWGAAFEFELANDLGDQVYSGLWFYGSNPDMRGPINCSSPPGSPFAYGFEKDSLDKIIRDCQTTIPKFRLHTFGCECGDQSACITDCFKTPAESWQLLLVGRYKENNPQPAPDRGDENRTEGFIYERCVGESLSLTAPAGSSDWEWFSEADELLSSEALLELSDLEPGARKYTLSATDECETDFNFTFEVVVADQTMIEPVSVQNLICGDGSGSINLEIVESGNETFQREYASAGCATENEPVGFYSADSLETTTVFSRNTFPEASMFGEGRGQRKAQFYYDAEAISRFGLSNETGGKIYGLAFRLESDDAFLIVKDFKVKMRNGPAPELSMAEGFQFAGAAVFERNEIDVLGRINTLLFDRSFVWQGGPIILEVSYESWDGPGRFPASMAVEQAAGLIAEPSGNTYVPAENLEADTITAAAPALRLLRCRQGLAWSDTTGLENPLVRENLPPGAYTAIHEGANGCADTFQTTISTVSSGTFAYETDTICPGSTDGRIEVAAPLGEDYRYALGEETPPQRSPEFSDLAPGTYDVYVYLGDTLRCAAAEAVVPAFEKSVLEMQHYELMGCEPGDSLFYLNITVNPLSGVLPFRYAAEAPQDFETGSINTTNMDSTRVYIEDGAGCVSDTMFYNPNPERPEAAFTWEAQGLAVSFTNASKRLDRWYAWTFGDEGVIQDEENPSYTYEFPGEYEVCLSAWHAECERVFCDTVSVTMVSRSETENAGALAVYPNPAKDELTVVWPKAAPAKATLQVFDAQGRLALERTLNPDDGTVRLDVSGLAAGAYILRAESSAGVFRGTFVKD